MSIELPLDKRRPLREKIFRVRRKKFSGDRLRFLRVERGLSQEQLAVKIDYTRAQISNVERGISTPSLRFLEAAKAALDVTMEDLWA